MNEYRWEDLSVGLSHEFPVVVTASMMKRFEDVTGDVNPLHVDAAFARARSFAGPVVYGMLTSSFYSTLVGVHLPGQNALLQAIRVNFHRPVYVGSELVVQGRIAHLSEAVRRIEIDAAIRDAGEVVSSAKISVGLHG